MTRPPNDADRPGAVVRAVLFDLDDTLFDHQYCAQAALETVHCGHDGFQSIPFAEFRRRHAELLEDLHQEVMFGRLDIDTAREERFRRLFLGAGITPSDEVVREIAAGYRRSYVQARRSVSGAAALLARVRERATVVIVSNNILDEQQQKLRQCGLDALIDDLVVSEEVGVSKPDPKIFEVALERAGATKEEAVMFGDSWSADITGARRAGMRAIWFNRHGAARPEPAADVAEVRALEPVEDVLGVIFSITHANRR